MSGPQPAQCPGPSGRRRSRSPLPAAMQDPRHLLREARELKLSERGEGSSPASPPRRAAQPPPSVDLEAPLLEGSQLDGSSPKLSDGRGAASGGEEQVLEDRGAAHAHPGLHHRQLGRRDSRDLWRLARRQMGELQAGCRAQRPARGRMVYCWTAHCCLGRSVGDGGTVCSVGGGTGHPMAAVLTGNARSEVAASPARWQRLRHSSQRMSVVPQQVGPLCDQASRPATCPPPAGLSYREDPDAAGDCGGDAGYVVRVRPGAQQPAPSWQRASGSGQPGSAAAVADLFVEMLTGKGLGTGAALRTPASLIEPEAPGEAAGTTQAKMAGCRVCSYSRVLCRANPGHASEEPSVLAHRSRDCAGHAACYPCPVHAPTCTTPWQLCFSALP